MVASPFPKQVYEQNAEIYKILANPKRLEILNIIKHHEACVDDLAKVVKARKANISQHLAVLRHFGLVNVRRNGLNAYYQVIDPRIIEPCRILKELREGK